MSWDISICKFSRRYLAVEEIPDDAALLSIGSRAEVHQAILAVFPQTDWADPAWGSWESGCGSIEFNVGDRDPSEGFMLHVRAGSEVVRGIVQLCLANGWQGLDTSTGQFIELAEDPEQGLASWRAYRDQVVGRT